MTSNLLTKVCSIPPLLFDVLNKKMKQTMVFIKLAVDKVIVILKRVQFLRLCLLLNTSLVESRCIYLH